MWCDLGGHTDPVGVGQMSRLTLALLRKVNDLERVKRAPAWDAVALVHDPAINRTNRVIVDENDSSHCNFTRPS